MRAIIVTNVAVGESFAMLAPPERIAALTMVKIAIRRQGWRRRDCKVKLARKRRG